jgi:hypothetical protein
MESVTDGAEGGSRRGGWVQAGFNNEHQMIWDEDGVVGLLKIHYWIFNIGYFVFFDLYFIWFLIFIWFLFFVLWRFVNLPPRLPAQPSQKSTPPLYAVEICAAVNFDILFFMICTLFDFCSLFFGVLSIYPHVFLLNPRRNPLPLCKG